MADDFISDEDKALFRDYMRSVKPLNEKTRRVKILPPPVTEQIKQKSTASHPTKKDYYLSDYISDTVYSQSTLSYAHPSLPGTRFSALKKGQIPWETKLDLHGFKTEPARIALTQFLQDQIQNNKRCLLIIHGKGGHLNEPPIIKNLINRWLPQIDEVLAFHSALAKDGGNGAVYVLLKKSRSESGS